MLTARSGHRGDTGEKSRAWLFPGELAAEGGRCGNTSLHRKTLEACLEVVGTVHP